MKGVRLRSICIMVAIGGLIDNTKGANAQRVETTPSLLLERQEVGRLPCRYNRAVYAAYWYKGPAASQDSLLVYLDVYHGKGSRAGPGYTHGGRFNITDDFTLTIRNVDMTDSGHYICQVSDFDLGRVFKNYTDVMVLSRADPREPVVSECLVKAPGECEYTLPVMYGEEMNVELICQVTGVSPSINLTWNSATDKIASLPYPVVNVTEESGLYNVTSTLHVSQAQDGDKYECVATGLAVDGNSSVTVSIMAPSEKRSLLEGASIYIVAAAAIFGLVIAVVIAVVLWSKRSGKKITPHALRDEDKKDCETLLAEIKNYKPGKSLSIDDEKSSPLQMKIRLGVYGATNAGKSSLVRSIIYAVCGEYIPIEVSQAVTAAGGVTTAPKSYKVTENVTLVDNPGLRDFSKSNIPAIIQKIRGEDKQLPDGGVDCPILVFDPRNPTQALGEFLPALFQKMQQDFGVGTQLPIIFTHKEEVKARIKTITDETKAIGALDSKLELFCIENFTEKPTKPCLERNLEFLRITSHFLCLADSNMMHRIDKKDGIIEGAECKLLIESAQ